MTTKFDISEAEPADASAIAALFALSWGSPFSLLQFGQLDTVELAASMVPRITEQMVKASSKFTVARHREARTVAAVAQWTVPTEMESTTVEEETQEDRDERQQFEDEALRQSLLDSTNKDLVMAFTLGLRKLREETLQGKKHLLLENLATHPNHRGIGLASRLVEWAFPLADEQHLLIYLDTASDNPAARMYKKLGFEEQGRNTIENLSQYASVEYIQELECDTQHTHVAFLRFPEAVGSSSIKSDRKPI